MRMQAGYTYNTISAEEIREIAQALQESNATSRCDPVSEAELQQIINALQESTSCGAGARVNESPLLSIPSEVLDDDETVAAAKTGVVETSQYPNPYPQPRNLSEMDSLEPCEIISNEEVEEIRNALEKGDLCEATHKLSQSLKDIENAHLNIAITGESGAGKSTFVNAIRGLDDEEEGAAKTGAIQTTMEPTAYKHQQYNNVTVWDLPGIGTPTFKPDNYLRDVKFDQYDFFIIMSSERFRHNDMILAKEIQLMGKKFYFVRSKVDSDLHAARLRRKKTYNEEKILNEIRDNCVKCLSEGGIKDPKVFLLSCLDLNKYDFSQMHDILEQELPNHKRYVFMLCLPNISLPILQKKRDALKKEIWKWASVSCAVATVPLPGLSVACDVGILVKEMKKYRDAFGLDPKSLEKLANKFEKDVNELKSVIKSPIMVKEINKELVTTLLTRGAMGSLMLVEYLASNIPMVGTLVAGGISFGTTYGMLYYFLKDIADDAVRVLEKALESSV